MQLAEKAKNCVLLGVPEMDTDKNTENIDAILIDRILLDAAIDHTHLIANFRHGKPKLDNHGQNRPRILKIKLDSEEAREKLLKSFRLSRPDTLPSTPTSLAITRKRSFKWTGS
jgi:hypothetical protein